jgi:hypothetical protein
VSGPLDLGVEDHFVVQHDPAVGPHADYISRPAWIEAEVVAVAQLVVGDGFERLFREAEALLDGDGCPQHAVIDEAGVRDVDATTDLIAPILITGNIVRLAKEREAITGLIFEPSLGCL